MSNSEDNKIISENNFIKHCFHAEGALFDTSAPNRSYELADGCHSIGRELVRQIDKETFKDEEKTQQITQDIVNIFNDICTPVHRASALDSSQGKEHLEQIVMRSGISYGILSGVVNEVIHQNNNPLKIKS